MRTSRQRRRRATTVATPKGNLYAVPQPLPVGVPIPDILEMNKGYMRALLDEQPTIGVAMYVQVARMAKQFTQRFSTNGHRKTK